MPSLTSFFFFISLLYKFGQNQWIPCCHVAVVDHRTRQNVVRTSTFMETRDTVKGLHNLLTVWNSQTPQVLKDHDRNISSYYKAMWAL